MVYQWCGKLDHNGKRRCKNHSIGDGGDGNECEVRRVAGGGVTLFLNIYSSNKFQRIPASTKVLFTIFGHMFPDLSLRLFLLHLF